MTQRSSKFLCLPTSHEYFTCWAGIKNLSNDSATQSNKGRISTIYIAQRAHAPLQEKNPNTNTTKSNNKRYNQCNDI